MAVTNDRKSLLKNGCSGLLLAFNEAALIKAICPERKNNYFQRNPITFIGNERNKRQCEIWDPNAGSRIMTSLMDSEAVIRFYLRLFIINILFKCYYFLFYSQFFL